MPWLLGTSAAAVTTYAICRVIKNFLSNSPEEDNSNPSKNKLESNDLHENKNPNISDTNLNLNPNIPVNNSIGKPNGENVSDNSSTSDIKAKQEEEKNSENSNEKKSKDPSISNTNSNSNMSADSPIKEQTPIDVGNSENWQKEGNAWEFFRQLKTQDEKIREPQMLKFIYLSALQIKELHDTGCIHGEMFGADFIIYTNDKNIKIELRHGFLNKSKKMIDTFQTRGRCVMSFLSPEWCSVEEDEKVNIQPTRDVWAFGCMIYRFLKDKVLFDIVIKDNNIHNIQGKKNELKTQHYKYLNDGKEWTQKYKDDPGTSSNRRSESRWQQTPEDLDELIERCLIIDENRRATMEEIIKWSGELLTKRGVSGLL